MYRVSCTWMLNDDDFIDLIHEIGLEINIFVDWKLFSYVFASRFWKRRKQPVPNNITLTHNKYILCGLEKTVNVITARTHKLLKYYESTGGKF